MGLGVSHSNHVVIVEIATDIKPIPIQSMTTITRQIMPIAKIAVKMKTGHINTICPNLNTNIFATFEAWSSINHIHIKSFPVFKKIKPDKKVARF